MAFPKKKSRKIIIDNHPFRWVVKGGYSSVILMVISEEHNSQKLIAKFRHNINGQNCCLYNNPFIVEPRLVKETIAFGISIGYSPEKKGNDINLGDLSEDLVLKSTGNKN